MKIRLCYRAHNIFFKKNLIYIYSETPMTRPPTASGVARGLSQGEQNLAEGGH